MNRIALTEAERRKALGHVNSAGVAARFAQDTLTGSHPAHAALRRVRVALAEARHLIGDENA